jgi:hypothetical protein
MQAHTVRLCEVDPAPALANPGLVSTINRRGVGKDWGNFMRRRVELPVAELPQILGRLDL